MHVIAAAPKNGHSRSLTNAPRKSLRPTGRTWGSSQGEADRSSLKAHPRTSAPARMRDSDQTQELTTRMLGPDRERLCTCCRRAVKECCEKARYFGSWQRMTRLASRTLRCLSCGASPGCHRRRHERVSGTNPQGAAAPPRETRDTEMWRGGVVPKCAGSDTVFRAGRARPPFASVQVHVGANKG